MKICITPFLCQLNIIKFEFESRFWISFLNEVIHFQQWRFLMCSVDYVCVWLCYGCKSLYFRCIFLVLFLESNSAVTIVDIDCTVVWEASNSVTPEPAVVENMFFDVLVERNMVAKLTGGIRDSIIPGQSIDEKLFPTNFFM